MSRKESFRTAVAFTLVTTAIFLLSGSTIAQTFEYSIVHSFGAPRMGLNPYSPLLLDNKGRLYGTTEVGGTFRYGVIYEISATGAEKAIYSFTGGADGGYPFAGLISDPAGNLYGIAYVGGDLTCNAPQGCGTIFKVDSSHNFSVLHAFTENEGSAAFSNLLRDQSGNLYGSLYSGGNSGYGTVFKLDPAGNLTVLYSFGGGADGGVPNGLIIDKVGNLYGTTQTGGIGGIYGYGTVFKIDPAGHITNLYNFAGGNDGYHPQGALARDSAGNVYGATAYGGDPICTCGTLFKLNVQSRTETVLHSFTGGDGEYPNGHLILDSAGNLYGTGFSGGSYGSGVVFMLDPNGVYSLLYDFAGGLDGKLPYAGLIMDRTGNLFGTTYYGGGNGDGVGTVYKLTRQ